MRPGGREAMIEAERQWRQQLHERKLAFMARETGQLCMAGCHNGMKTIGIGPTGGNGFAYMVSFALDFVPVVGEAKGLFEAASGRDYITGEYLSPTDRAYTAAAGVPVPGSKHFAKAFDKIVDGAGSAAKKVTQGVVRASRGIFPHGRSWARRADDIGPAATEMASFYAKRADAPLTDAEALRSLMEAPNRTGGQLSVPQKVFTSTDVPADVARPRGTFVTEIDITQPQNLVPHVQNNVPWNPARPPGSLPRYVTEIDVPQGSVLPDPTVPFKPNDPTGWLPPRPPGARVNQVYAVIEDAMGNVTIRPVGGGS